jgi:glutaminyl-tRNA synthetase
MKMGIHEEGSLSLRLKIDPAHENPTLRDPHIYRIRFTPHPHCGDKWCIYPLYDFTHCKLYLKLIINIFYLT